ncbi:MAG: hypothetical protein GEU82_18095 [Luteitalea sp.]|nr:hypothetical protein [Luteitalea sp.]
MAADDGPYFRLFLKDGSSLVSFGEMARVDDRVVFSMPTSVATSNPDLHLVTIPADRVDWEKTTGYAESARASRYLSTRAESDYALLTGAIAQAVNDVALTSDVAERLAIVQKARKVLAEWPSTHFGFKQDEIYQMLGTLDEAIAELRAATGAQQFDLALVAATPAPPEREPLMPAPTLRESIEQTLVAARLTPSPEERTSLLTVAVATLDREAASLPPAWVASTRRTANTEIARERRLDRAYQALSDRFTSLAARRARDANVRGVERLLARVDAQDAVLGRARPDALKSLLTSIEQQLDAARRLRLERDRWAMRLPELRRYRVAIRSAIARLAALKPSLEDIKALAGSSHGTLEELENAARQVMRSLSIIPAPDEYRDAHALLASAAQLASTAAGIRREAVLASNMARAWDASSAAAGAIMLTARAQAEIQGRLRPPQLPR